MLRRNFLAALLTPLLARFAPKIPISQQYGSRYYIPFEFCIKPALSHKLMLLQLHKMDPSLVNVTEIWKRDEAPFIKLEIPERWPWEA